jgi:hypothetical protein
MDFISREALIAAMNAWVLDKAKHWPKSPHCTSQLAMQKI